MRSSGHRDSRDAEFSEYVALRWRTLVRSAQLLGCTEAQAEDTVQSALLKCYVSWSKVSRADEPDAYVYRVLLNTWRDQRRRRWWGERPTDELPDTAPDETNDGAEDVGHRDAVERALGGLNREHREVVVLRFYLDLTTPQIAAVLGVPAGTVRSRLSRALDALAHDQHLSRQLDEHLTDPTGPGGNR